MGACFRPQSSLGLEDRGEILIIVTGSGGPGAGLARSFHFFYPYLPFGLISAVSSGTDFL
jgi:hypothetical protein